MRLLRVNMGTLRSQWEEIPDKWSWLGNRGLTAKLLWREVDPACEPLGARNKLVLATGLLAAAPVSSAQRLSVAAKSPLTGGIKEANSGGQVGMALARLGVRALIVEGEPREDRAYILVLDPDGIRLEPARELEGLGVMDAARRLGREWGPDYALALVGPAAEMGYGNAAVMVTDAEGNPGRAAARGGLGAVMRRRGLQAIAVSSRGTHRLEPERPEAFQAARKEYHDLLTTNPHTSQKYPAYGTSGIIPTINAMGGMPTRSFRSGAFEEADGMGPEVLYELIKKRGGQGNTTHACMPGCVIRCSNIMPRDDGEMLVSPLEYETMAMVGSNLGIGDLDAIGEINRRCNDYGMDTIETGVAIGIAMDVGMLEFGDVPGTLELLEEMARGTVLGRVLGQGAAVTGKVLQSRRVPVVKNQGIPAHEPRAIKGMTITYAMSPMGADHTAAVTIGASEEPTRPEGQMELSRMIQVFMAAYDTMGFCMFAMRPGKEAGDAAQRMVEAVRGQELGDDFWLRLGKDVIKTERLFNRAAGFTEAHDRLPEFMTEEPVPPTGAVSDIPAADYRRFWEEEFWGPLDEIW